MDIRSDYSGTQLGKYYLIQKLGNGGFGVVYKACDQILQVEKAIKILEVTDPKQAFRLFNEASIPYKCQHNHIIKINSGEIIEYKGEVLFVIDMDLAQGQSIENILKHSYISVIDSLHIIRDILFAVEYSHLQGIIHRDIKPANILMDNGVPKLSDFGLSTALGDVIIPWRWYRTHAAPETYMNNSIATVKTDIFALGMTLYRMVNSIENWDLFLQSIPNAERLMETGKLIDKLPFSPIVPEKIYKIIRKACRKNPDDRYRTATEMRNAIEKLCPFYNWRIVDKDYWIGNGVGVPQKDIFIELKSKSVDVVVKNNGRRSSKDSKQFTDLIKAKIYLQQYIKMTTLQ